MFCAFGRGRISLDISSARLFMVHLRRSGSHTRPPLRAHFLPLAPRILIVLSFQCMAALFNPVHRRWNGIRWGVVSYTAVMFSAMTVQTTMNLQILSICYIDNRKFLGKGALGPGPYGYFMSIYTEALNDVIPNVMFPLSNRSSDGFFWLVLCPDAATTRLDA